MTMSLLDNDSAENDSAGMTTPALGNITTDPTPPLKPVRNDINSSTTTNIDILCPNKFRCANNHCVPLGWTCDNEDDCGDGSDEEAANCPVEQGGDGEGSTPQTTGIPGSGENTTRNPTAEESMGTTSAARTTLNPIVNRGNFDLTTRLPPHESTATNWWEEDFLTTSGGEDDRAFHDDSSTRIRIQENPGRSGSNQVQDENGDGINNTVYVIIAASVGTASVVGFTVAAVVVVCRARKGGRRSIDHYDFSEDTQVEWLSDQVALFGIRKSVTVTNFQSVTCYKYIMSLPRIG